METTTKSSNPLAGSMDEKLRRQRERERERERLQSPALSFHTHTHTHTHTQKEFGWYVLCVHKNKKKESHTHTHTHTHKYYLKQKEKQKNNRPNIKRDRGCYLCASHINKVCFFFLPLDAKLFINWCVTILSVIILSLPLIDSDKRTRQSRVRR